MYTLHIMHKVCRHVPRMGSWAPGTPLFSLKMQDFASFFEKFPGEAPRTPPPPLKGTGARAWYERLGYGRTNPKLLAPVLLSCALCRV